MTEYIKLQCETCGTWFDRQAKDHRNALKRGRTHVYCSKDCSNAGHLKYKYRTRLCAGDECGNTFEFVEPEQKFCSHSCSAKFNNKRRPKQEPKPKKISILNVQKPRPLKPLKLPKFEVGVRGLDYCSVTLQDILDRYDRLSYHAKIRGNSRSVYGQSGRPMFCFVCRYDLHVDVCHIIDVSAFPMDTAVCVVNDIDNLTALCKNHHWEFDHGFLELEFQRAAG